MLSICRALTTYCSPSFAKRVAMTGLLASPCHQRRFFYKKPATEDVGKVKPLVFDGGHQYSPKDPKHPELPSEHELNQQMPSLRQLQQELPSSTKARDMAEHFPTQVPADGDD